MIQYIRGELAALEEDRIIVDVGGIGYGIFMSVQSMSSLPPVGSEVRIYTYLNVKEDAMQLFGFLTRDDLSVFKLLIGVNGIGPKGGQAVLSVLSPDAVSGQRDSHSVQNGGGEVQSEAVQALVALGYGSTEALKAVKQVEISEDTDVETVLKKALKNMMF